MSSSSTSDLAAGSAMGGFHLEEVMDLPSFSVQEFVELLQEWTSGPEGALQVVAAPLHDYELPPRYSHQHLAVQYCTLSTALLSG